MNSVRRIGIEWMGLAAATLILSGVVPALANDAGARPAEDAQPSAITPVTASKGSISFGNCHFQKTPPYEPRTKLECENGEVVVAVFDDGIRCCELQLR